MKQYRKEKFSSRTLKFVEYFALGCLILGAVNMFVENILICRYLIK